MCPSEWKHATINIEDLDIEDPQTELENICVESGNITAKVGLKSGHSLLFEKVSLGELEMVRTHKYHIRNRKAEEAHVFRTPKETEGGSFTSINLAAQFNGDISQIFKFNYMSPRPNTASTRIGSDGYSNWTYLAWGKRPPEIRFDVPGDGMIRTESSVPFASGSNESNIIYTSVWDNWPTKVNVEVNQFANIAWLLVCGSTNCMQGKIENARLEFIYTDSTKEYLSLVHPDNFWTLAHTCGVDYDYEKAGWPLPTTPPHQIQFGENCRAMVLSMRLRLSQRCSGVCRSDT